MDRTIFDRYFEPPPRLIEVAEALPHLGGLQLAPFVGELPGEIELHPVERWEGAFDDERARELLKRALAISKVRDRIGRARCLPIGISRRGEPAKGERRVHLVVVYDYTANTAVEITLDEQGELLQMSDERYQPPPIDSEIARAIELARLDPRIESKVKDLVPMAIPLGGPETEGENRRVIEVLFGCRADRLPQLRAVVDLSTETVIRAGGTSSCCGHEENQR
jgi:hypothetical protein